MGPKVTLLIAIFAFLAFCFGCGQTKAVVDQKVQQTAPAKTPDIPPTLSEILDKKNTITESALGKFDFRNFTFPLPRGWQDVDSKEITLENGERGMTEDRIGMSYLTTKFGDADGDGKDEAFVILRVRTGGGAIPHLVYVFEWKDGAPEILWYFRTGDRSDGGLKRVYADKGNLVVELFGQDRYIFGQMETLKIVGDEPRLCCPSNFTRNVYKREANTFRLEGPRLTYSLQDPKAAPIENLGDKKLEESRGKNQ